MTDQNRFLGTDLPHLQLRGFSGEEAMSSIYTYSLECYSDELTLKPKEVIGRKCAFWVMDDNGAKRYFAGIVRKIAAGSLMNSNRREFYVDIVPSLYLLTQNIRTRAFEEKTSVDIIKVVLADHGIKIGGLPKGTYVTREYCVQYNESDYHFISRLLEDEGISYYFTHAEGGEQIVFVDQASAYGDCVEKDVIQSFSTTANSHIEKWAENASYHTGEWEMNAYDPLKPSSLVNSKKKGKTDAAKLAKQQRTIYRSPLRSAEGKEKALLDNQTMIRMEEEESNYEIVNANSSYRTFTPGCKIKLKDHDISSFVGKEYVITTIYHSAYEGENVTGRESGHSYRNDFNCIPANVVFRPKRNTPRPRIFGLLTGIVTAQSADGPEVDKHGRLKIQLHWEKQGAGASSNCLARVSQTFAGKNWGSFVMPDIGHEVLVSFIDGDPDNPVIVGSVYNGENMIPLHSGGGKATQMGWKTSNGQEMTIENKKDNEKIYFHSVKDYETIVDNDAKKVVKKNKSLEITEGDDKIEIKKGKRTTTIEKDDSTTLNSGNYDLKVSTGNHTVKVDTGKADMTVAQGITITSNKEIKLVVGPNSIKIDMQGIELKTATASIKLDAAGKVATQALQVETKADLSLKMEGNISAELKSPLTTTVEGGVKAELKSNVMAAVQAGAMANISGAIAKIN